MIDYVYAVDFTTAAVYFIINAALISDEDDIPYLC